MNYTEGTEKLESLWVERIKKSWFSFFLGAQAAGVSALGEVFVSLTFVRALEDLLAWWLMF